MVEDNSVVKKPEFRVGEVQVVLCFFGKFFPVADGVVREVADGASCEPEFFVVNCPFFDEFLNYANRIAIQLMVFIAGAFVADNCFSILYCGG